MTEPESSEARCQHTFGVVFDAEGPDYISCDECGEEWPVRELARLVSGVHHGQGVMGVYFHAPDSWHVEARKALGLDVSPDRFPFEAAHNPIRRKP